MQLIVLVTSFFNVRHSQLKLSYRKHILSAPIDNSRDAYLFFKTHWDKGLINIQEQVYAIFLNGNNEVISWRQVNTGNTNESLFDIKLMVACALNCLATKIIVAHNHPSGILKPSEADIMVTRQLQMGSLYLCIEVSDHLIITDRSYYSFKDNGLI